MRLARRPPDETHPFGHGRDVYFWAFVVSMMLFTVGARSRSGKASSGIARHGDRPARLGVRGVGRRLSLRRRVVDLRVPRAVGGTPRPPAAGVLARQSRPHAADRAPSKTRRRSRRSSSRRWDSREPRHGKRWTRGDERRERAVSSRSTVSSVGSRLSRQYSSSGRPRRAADSARNAKINDAPSKRKPPANTPNAQSGGPVSWARDTA